MEFIISRTGIYQEFTIQNMQIYPIDDRLAHMDCYLQKEFEVDGFHSGLELLNFR